MSKGKDRWRESHTAIQLAIPFREELRAEAEVRGCSIGRVIELHLDAHRHLLMSPGELIKHLKKYHPERVHAYEPGSPEDWADQEKEYQAQVEFANQMEVVLERNQKKMKASRAIARRKAGEKRAKAEVGQ